MFFIQIQEGYSFLHIAANTNFPACAEFLIANGADVNMLNKVGLLIGVLIVHV
jgi:ankyrin repeat protein